ncbi:unnamed protein product [Echinostoma caproni]|uniref:Laminin N-terminal domain-containing protein n=1 Tax=Echinostoma caproni TaxID=27848 RepID=A0A183A6A0_9TREM|nr:unnamed protein product [Echinostoma caproni]
MRFTHAHFTLILCVWLSLPHVRVESVISENVTWYPIDENRTIFRNKRQLGLEFDSSASRCRIGTVDLQCLPPFKNIVHGVNVRASANCGVERTQRLCRSDGTCQLCGPHPKRQFAAEYLTDIHDPQNQTCWASGFIRPGGPEQAVNLTLSLGKRFEVYYISLQPCSVGSLPDSIAIYKSSDFGRNWRPWHYFSTDCYRAFGLPTTDEYNSHITSANLQEVLCVALQPHEGYLNRQMRRRRSMGIHLQHGTLPKDPKQLMLDTSNVAPDWVIAFSTTLGRPSQRPWSPALIDWMTMTDIRISLMRFRSSNRGGEYESKRRELRAASGNFVHHSLPFGLSAPENQFRRRSYLGRDSYADSYPRTRHQMRDVTSRDLSASNPLNNRLFTVNGTVHPSEEVVPEVSKLDSMFPGEPDILSDNEFYAFADLAIGGRCKCNGHASDCFLGSDGRLRCACEHNTEGDDCERCKSGYMDKPWERATAQKANACTSEYCIFRIDTCYSE